MMLTLSTNGGIYAGAVSPQHDACWIKKQVSA